MRYFKTLKNFFKKNKDNEEEVDGIESDEMYVSDASATIEIRLDSNTGDFNIVVGVDEISNECSRNLALILYMNTLRTPTKTGVKTIPKNNFLSKIYS